MEAKSMSLIPDDLRKLMLANGKRSARSERFDPFPAVKLFTPWGGATWLLSELDPSDPDIAFGLCDLGMGFPELGSVRLSELESVKGPFGLSVERDVAFLADKTLAGYAEEARRHGTIKA
jgi:hypothetical protein